MEKRNEYGNDNFSTAGSSGSKKNYNFDRMDDIDLDDGLEVSGQSSLTEDDDWSDTIDRAEKVAKKAGRAVGDSLANMEILSWKTVIPAVALLGVGTWLLTRNKSDQRSTGDSIKNVAGKLTGSTSRGGRRRNTTGSSRTRHTSRGSHAHH